MQRGRRAAKSWPSSTQFNPNVNSSPGRPFRGEFPAAPVARATPRISWTWLAPRRIPTPIRRELRWSTPDVDAPCPARSARPGTYQRRPQQRERARATHGEGPPAQHARREDQGRQPCGGKRRRISEAMVASAGGRHEETPNGDGCGAPRNCLFARRDTTPRRVSGRGNSSCGV